MPEVSPQSIEQQYQNWHPPEPADQEKQPLQLGPADTNAVEHPSAEPAMAAENNKETERLNDQHKAREKELQQVLRGLASKSGNPFVLFGVKANATKKELRSAYRQMASEYHPDRNHQSPKIEETAKKILQTINETYNVGSTILEQRGTTNVDAAPVSDFAKQAQKSTGSRRPEQPRSAYAGFYNPGLDLNQQIRTLGENQYIRSRIDRDSEGNHYLLDEQDQTKRVAGPYEKITASAGKIMVSKDGLSAILDKDGQRLTGWEQNIQVDSKGRIFRVVGQGEQQKKEQLDMALEKLNRGVEQRIIAQDGQFYWSDQEGNPLSQGFETIEARGGHAVGRNQTEKLEYLLNDNGETILQGTAIHIKGNEAQSLNSEGLIEKTIPLA